MRKSYLGRCHGHLHGVFVGCTVRFHVQLMLLQAGVVRTQRQCRLDSFAGLGNYWAAMFIWSRRSSYMMQTRCEHYFCGEVITQEISCPKQTILAGIFTK